MKSRSTLASQFARRLQGLSHDYEAVQAALERLTMGAAASLAGEPQVVAELATLVAGLRRQAAESVSICRDWEQNGRPQSLELQQQLRQQETQLERLLTQVQLYERQCQTVREQLRPQLDQVARRRAMQRAYGELLIGGKRPACPE